MSSLKPVIHGRDHLPGGADPIPVIPGSTWTPAPVEEHLVADEGAIAGNATTFISWSRYSGGTFLDLTDPTKPTITEPGLYMAMASGNVDVDSSTPGGYGVDFFVGMVQFAGPSWPPSAEDGFHATYELPIPDFYYFKVAANRMGILTLDGGTPDYITSYIRNRGVAVTSFTAYMSVIQIFAL